MFCNVNIRRTLIIDCMCHSEITQLAYTFQTCNPQKAGKKQKYRSTKYAKYKITKNTHQQLVWFNSAATGRRQNLWPRVTFHPILTAMRISIITRIIGADYVLRRRRYCDHFVMMVYVYVCTYVCGCVLCQHDKTKTLDQNELKLRTEVVLDTMSKPTDLDGKGQASGAQAQNLQYGDFRTPSISL